MEIEPATIKEAKAVMEIILQLPSKESLKKAGYLIRKIWTKSLVLIMVKEREISMKENCKKLNRQNKKSRKTILKLRRERTKKRTNQNYSSVISYRIIPAPI